MNLRPDVFKKMHMLAKVLNLYHRACTPSIRTDLFPCHQVHMMKSGLKLCISNAFLSQDSLGLDREPGKIKKKSTQYLH